MPLDPVTLGIGAAASVPSLIQAYNQNRALERLLQQGPQDLAPVAFRQMQQGLENQANNAQIAGYGQAMDNLNENVSSTLGEAKRAGISSSNLLNVLTRLNQQKNRATRDLALQGAQMKEARLNRALAAKQRRAEYQEQGRQEFNRTTGALRAARDQNINAGVQNLLGTGLMSYTPKAAPTPEPAPEMMETMTPTPQFDLAPNFVPPATLQRANVSGTTGYKVESETPYLDSMYRNALDPEVVAARIRASRKPQPLNPSQMLRTQPYNSF